MSDNYGRNNLVTRFKCSKCGNQLTLSAKDESPVGLKEYERDGITGASKVENDIFIEPCKTCVDKPQKQLDTLKEILKG